MFSTAHAYLRSVLLSDSPYVINAMLDVAAVQPSASSNSYASFLLSSPPRESIT